MTRRSFFARVIGAAVAMTVPWESAPVKKRFEARIVQAFGRRMSKAEWMELDVAVLRAARVRLRTWVDLQAVNQFGGGIGIK